MHETARRSEGVDTAALSWSSAVSQLTNKPEADDALILPPSLHQFSVPGGYLKLLSPLSPKSDQHEISPYNINASENRVVMRTEYMIRDQGR